MQTISKLTYLPPTAFGQETSQRPTARGTIALIAEAGQPFNLLAGRVLKIVLGLITDTRKMYEEHWDNNYARDILNDKGQQKWNVLSPEMIAGDYLAVSEIDLEAQNSSFDKQADQLMFQTLSQDPFVNQNPAFAWEIRANYIQSLGKKNVEKYIGPKPDYENNPGIIDDENHTMLQESNVEVHQNDDDVAHMNGHSQFKRQMANVMTREALAILVGHILEHRAQYQAKLQQSAMVQQEGGQPGQQGASVPMATPGGSSIQGPRIGSNAGQNQIPSGMPSAQ